MLSDNIRKYRRTNDMSQDDLAEKLGVSRQSISLWETGQTQPTIDNILALAKVFNVSTDAILGNTGSESPPRESAPVKKRGVNLPFILIVVTTLLAAGIILTIALLSNSKTPAGKSGSETPSPTGTAVAVDPTEPDKTDAPTEKAAAKPTAAPTTAKADTRPTAKQTVKPTTKPTARPTAAPTAPPQTFDLFEYCKDFAIRIGTLNGDYCIYQQPATRYGGYENEYFSISYWGDSNMVEFCLHCPLSETFSVNFYLRMRGGFNHRYEYLTSRYYRSSGASLRSATGYIDPAVFSDYYPLSCDRYEGSVDGQDAFMEESRVGICDLIRLLKAFVKAEGMECDFDDFEFKNF